MTARRASPRNDIPDERCIKRVGVVGQGHLRRITGCGPPIFVRPHCIPLPEVILIV